MSWGSKVINNQGECVQCALQCANHEGCNIAKVQWPMTNILSSVDRCSEGINDYGTMELRCNGFAPKPQAEPEASQGAAAEA